LHHASTLAPEIEATAPGSLHGAFYLVKKLPGKYRARCQATGAVATDRASGSGRYAGFEFPRACLARPVLQIDDPKNFLAPLPIETLRYLPQL
jgi:hypothetical protein